MRGTIALICALAGLMPGAAPPALAESRVASDCIIFDRNKQPSEDTVLGWLVNICTDKYVAVVHQFDIDEYGNKVGPPWCANHPKNSWYLPTERILEPGERLGVGWQLYGKAKDLGVAACEVDTSINNSVNITLSPPEFLFEEDCRYQCR